MKTINYQLLLFCITLLCSFYTLAVPNDCSDGQQYGYGKLFYNGVAHTNEAIYPLRMQQAYNAPDPINDNRIYKENSLQSHALKIVIKAEELEGNINVSVENKSDKSIVIPKKNTAVEGRLSNPIFSITSGCIYLDYVGELVNFGSVYQYPDDYVTIESDHKYETIVKLGRYYHFLPSVHAYEIFIPETPFYFKDKIGSDELFVESNKIHITITAPVKIN